MTNKQCPCSGCAKHYDCEKIAEGGGFPRWGCLIRCLKNDMKPAWLRRELIRAAKEFVPDTIFYGNSSHAITNAPYGQYIWSFVIMMRQEQIWNYPEFQAGYADGRYSPSPDRDNNPYVEPARQSSWDKGYILGLHGRATREV